MIIFRERNLASVFRMIEFTIILSAIRLAIDPASSPMPVRVTFATHSVTGGNSSCSFMKELVVNELRFLQDRLCVMRGTQRVKGYDIMKIRRKSS